MLVSAFGSADLELEGSIRTMAPTIEPWTGIVLCPIPMVKTSIWGSVWPRRVRAVHGGLEEGIRFVPLIYGGTAPGFDPSPFYPGLSG